MHRPSDAHTAWPPMLSWGAFKELWDQRGGGARGQDPGASSGGSLSQMVVIKIILTSNDYLALATCQALF